MKIKTGDQEGSITLHLIRSEGPAENHPSVALDRCDRCGESVTLHKCGEKIIKYYGRHFVEVVCNMCEPNILSTDTRVSSTEEVLA